MVGVVLGFEKPSTPSGRPVEFRSAASAPVVHELLGFVCQVHGWGAFNRPLAHVAGEVEWFGQARFALGFRVSRRLRISVRLFVFSSRGIKGVLILFCICSVLFWGVTGTFL